MRRPIRWLMRFHIEPRLKLTLTATTAPLLATTNYTAVVSLPGAPSNEVAYALFNRSATKGEDGDIAGAVEDCTAVISMTDAPADLVAEALLVQHPVNSLIK